MRVVLDTNVVVSALLWRGTTFRLLEAIWRNESTHLFSSGPMMGELAGVLARPIHAKRLAAIGRTPAGVVEDYRNTVELVEVPVIRPVVSADPDDDIVVATAFSAAADLLITGDRALLAIRTYRGTEFVSPAAARLILTPGSN